MGFDVAKTVHGRLGKTIMELGGNNALIVTPSADLDMATQSIFFGAVGTAGQRCTSTRRVILHESVADKIRRKTARRLQVSANRQSVGEENVDGTIDRSERSRFSSAID